jgi:ubiquinol-cytochrome c reductase cytochrome b subunit
VGGRPLSQIARRGRLVYMSEGRTPTTRTGAAASWADDRLGLARFNVRLFSLRKVFPDHWSFLLGEIALWSFVVLLVTGVFLTMWFDPSVAEVVYQGSYEQLRGVPMSAAYASTLDISFDVRGGLLMRQMHHWAAHIFIASMMIHLLRHALTGSFRKPRELNWVIGSTMLLLGTIEGFAGYSLPDDLLSGTGLRAADGFVKATPVLGAYLSFLLFGGEFPGDQAISRLYILHVLLIPGLLVALVALHLIYVVYHKHTQWPGPGRTNANVVGYPFFPVYLAKATGFFLIVFGVIALMGGLLGINPLWKYGPYDPSKVTAGSQPDWYMGWPDGLLRIMPPWETHIAGYTISWNIILPILVAPLLLWLVVTTLPFLEQWVTGDRREHHMLQRPREAPTRTAVVAALIAFYGIAWAAGGNDIIATTMHLSLNQITYAFRVLIFLAPTVAFVLTRRWCLSLQLQEQERLQHGWETGVITRSPRGGYTERHAPLEPDQAAALSARERDAPLAPPERYDHRGVRQPQYLRRALRAKLSRLWLPDSHPSPTAADRPAARPHQDPPN